jgi:hypothetical protein
MLYRVLCFITLCLLFCPPVADAQMTYRLRGVVRDTDGKPVEGVRVRAEVITGFRGEQFVGQKEFEVKSNSKGEWSILGLTSGLWSFAASGPNVIPQVIVLPVSFSNRKPAAAQSGSFPWTLPLWVRRSTHPGLVAATTAATEKRVNDAVQAVGALTSETDAEVLCAAGEIALMVRQHGLATAIFEQILAKDAKHACATVGLGSAALMQNDFDRASKMLWAAVDLVPQEQKAAMGAAVKDLQQIMSTKQ